MIMEYQKIIFFFNNTSNQPTIFATKYEVEIYDDSHETPIVKLN